MSGTRPMTAEEWAWVRDNAESDATARLILKLREMARFVWGPAECGLAESAINEMRRKRSAALGPSQEAK